MNKKIIKKIINLLFLFIVLLGMYSNVFADDINTGDYTDIYNPGGTGGLNTMGGKILGLVQAIGTSVSVIMIVVIAIRYFVSAPDQKADVKSKLIPFLIGAILLFGASNLLSLLVTVVRDIFK